jgi:transposase
MDQLNGLRMQNHERTMRQMVAEIHQGKINIAQAAAKFEVNRKTVSHWLNKVEQEGEDNTRHFLLQEPPKRSSRRSSKQEVPDITELEAQVRSLERQLEEAQFKALYYSTLVRVAEQELGMDIEKKSVTKQSGSCS